VASSAAWTSSSRQRLLCRVAQTRELGQKERGIRQPLGRQDGGRAAGLDVDGSLAQQLDDRPVREAGLVLVAAGGEHHRPELQRVPGELVREARLPDPRLSLDHGQAAIRPRPGVGAGERRQLVAPSHERQLGRRLAELGVGRRGRRRLCLGWRGHGSLAHLVVEGRGLRDRRHPQLLTQRPDALPVLVERRRAVPAPGVQADELAMGGLVERIELEPAASVRNGLLVVAARRQPRHQAS
jgi:hypothetical protein